MSEAPSNSEKRVCFDFDLEFSNGGGIQGQGFRLDIDGDDIQDDALAAHLIHDMRLLMVGKVRILNKQIIQERHKRAGLRSTSPDAGSSADQVIDLSHTIENGMITVKGLPAPLICDYLSREQSRQSYAAGTEFQIGRIDMVANTGTYLDTPFHRYADGTDLAALELSRVSDVPAVVVRVLGLESRAIDWTHFVPIDCQGKAVLVNTGWDRHWRTPQYCENHPHLTAKAAEYLRDNGAVLVGIDSLNIDNTSGGDRPVHSILLRAAIPIVEHLTALGSLPTSGIRFSAVPPKIGGLGTFPVRAHAHVMLGEGS
jgi:kynurenine formamidase